MPSLAAYLCLLLSVFVAFSQALPIPPSLPTRNVTIAFNASQVKYSPHNWEVISALPSESSQSFIFSDVIGASFGVVLPNGTVAVDYIGVPRSAGAAYAVCIDCDVVDDTKGIWALVDGNKPDLVNDVQATPTVLFSIVALNPTIPHIITVTNIPDTRFNKTSEITFHSLNVTIADNNGKPDPAELSTGTGKPETSDPTDSSSTSAEPTSTSPSDSESAAQSDAEPTPTSDSSATESHSETSTSGTATSSDSEPTESPTDSEPTSSSVPPAEHRKVSSASPSPTADVNNGSNGSADSTAAPKTQKVSKTIIAVIVVLCVLALFCLATALVLTYRIRRKRAAARIHDAESQRYGNSQWFTSNVAPVAGMQEVPLSDPPPRPRNPFEDQFPPNVPLELETPGDSTLMNKRAVQRPRSSFGNDVYDYYDRPAHR